MPEQSGQNGVSDREDAAIARVGEELPAAATARSFGSMPLRESAPAAFAELVAAYGALLDQAVEHRAYRVETRGADAIRALSDRLGFLWARPRDLVQIHTAALATKDSAGTSPRASAYRDEGRILLLEIMGGLVMHYRRLSLGQGT